MKCKVKEYLLSVDYFAFMVAILLARHEVNKSNSEKQWSSAEISEELNNLAYGATTNFHVDNVALQHGMSIFQKQLRNRGLLAVTMGSDALGVRDFYDLVGATRIIEIKFVGYQKFPEHETESDLLCRILAIRTELLLKLNYPTPFHPSPASVLYELHLPMIRSLQAQKDVKASKKVRMTRKSPSKLGAKTIKKNSIDLLDAVKKNFGESNVEFYLNSAIKIEETKKRKLRDSTESSDEDSEKFDDGDDDDDDDNFALDDIENDERVLEMASQIPSKYIIFEIDDKKNVIALFKVIREVAEEREYVACDKIAALTTAKIINRINYYSTITGRCILRWCSVQDKIIEKSGPKIDNQFVSEVWGNLLLCILERKQNEVRLFVLLFIVFIIRCNTFRV